jgi:hypothetical protein
MSRPDFFGLNKETETCSNCLVRLYGVCGKPHVSNNAVASYRNLRTKNELLNGDL